ncbi:2,3-dihydroxybenzoate-AMP ligase [Streptomyces sp. V2]|uniref:AMP-binding protein n=1 Tax=Streptomyces sp. V2 TaxID=1424099 RepID=UPI000D670074|nr:AMP-binding protein [Streptomyces sp. V2]PWG11303.1 2,3-dihydroxybenzoate-AMP ligase [Streptomyces sp. V2]
MNPFRPDDPGLPRVPPDRAREYRDRGWWLPERVDRLALRHVDDDPGKEAVRGPGGRLTRRELADAVTGAATRLAALGIARGDRVLVQLPNDLELVVLPLALMRLGAHPVMAVPTLRRRELLAVVAATRPTAVAVPGRWQRFDHVALARELQESCPDLRHVLVADRASDTVPDGTEDLVALCRPDPGAKPLPDLGPPLADEPAVFLLSSGTTGPPKAIARAHEGYGYMIRTAARWAGLSADTVYLAVMSGAHGFVLNCPGMLGVLAFGGRIVLGSPGDPGAALDLVDREGVTHTTLVPALVTQWLDEVRRRGRGPKTLRVMQAGGARLEPTPAAEARKLLGCTVQQCYGMSEGLLTYTALDDPADVIAHTQGRPASPGDEIRVVAEDGTEVAPGETGELLTRGPYTVAGYYAAPEADARAFTADGFYRTGDLARRHPSGGLVVEGRIGDVINRGGEKISAGEIESLLGEHPLLRAVAAVAMPHPVWGQTVCVFAVPADPADPGKQPTLLGLRRFLTGHGIATYKLPEDLRIVDALPMIGVGKINRVALRAAAQERERTP